MLITELRQFFALQVTEQYAFQLKYPTYTKSIQTLYVTYIMYMKLNNDYKATLCNRYQVKKPAAFSELRSHPLNVCHFYHQSVSYISLFDFL